LEREFFRRQGVPVPAKRAVLVLELVLADLELVRRDLPRLLDDPFRRVVGRDAATVRLRLPYVSMPSGATAVSPWSTSTSSYGIPRRSATIWENVVTWLCPCGEVPISTCTVPVGRKRIVAASQPPAP